jgi:hypothetical protein
MIELFYFVLAVLALPFKAKIRLEAEKCSTPTSVDRSAA